MSDSKNNEQARNSSQSEEGWLCERPELLREGQRGAASLIISSVEDLAEAKHSLPGCSRKEMLEFWEGVMMKESAKFTGTKVPIGKMAWVNNMS